MKSFIFKKNLGTLDDRSVFANEVCRLVFKKHKGNLEESAKAIELYYDNFERFVRNVYEVIEREIPLFALYELKTHGRNNWDYSESEYQKAIKRCEEACIYYYG